MKVHIGADAETGVVHSVATTPANVHDVTEAHRLLHGGEIRVWGDAGYQGVDKRAENRELGVEWQVAMKPGQRRQLEPGSEEALAEKCKASVRAKVEHPFLYVKRHFGYAKVRYRGLAKNTQRLALLLGLTNLITADRYVVAWRGRSAPKPAKPAEKRLSKAVSEPQNLYRHTVRARTTSDRPLTGHHIRDTLSCSEVP